MRSDVTIRPAGTGDAEAIVELMRAGFSPALLETFIYGCPGVVAYVRSLVADADRSVDSRFWVAETNARVAGALEMRLVPDGLFLNYVAVSPEHRKRGMASALLASGLTLANTHQARELSLDVLDDNAPARAWYASLGMQHEASTGWWRGPLTGGDGHGVHGRIIGLPQARACHHAFGFGRFTVASPGAAHDVGLLGDRYFRVTTAAAAEDRTLRAILSRLDVHRSLLALVPSEVSLAAPFTRVATTHRLVAPLELVRTRLSGVVGDVP